MNTLAAPALALFDKHVARGPLALAAIIGVLVGAPSSAQAATIDDCRTAHEDFDYDQAVKLCAPLAEDATAEYGVRIEAYQLLATSQVALGKNDDAHNSFVALLILQPTFQLGPGASPAFRKALDGARLEIERRGALSIEKFELTVERGSAGPWPATLQITDQMERIAKVEVEMTAKQGATEVGRLVVDLAPAAPAEAGPRTFKGEVADPIESSGLELDGPYELWTDVRLVGHHGERLEAAKPVAPRSYPRAGMMEESEGGTGLWVTAGVVGAAGAGLLVLAAVGSGATVAGVCLGTPICFPPATPSHVRIEPAGQ